jgi:TolB-like protein
MTEDDLRHPSLPEPGELFAGRYRIEARLRDHGTARVYRALDHAVGETVSIELHTVSGTGELEYLRRRARLARRVTHRNVVRTYDIGVHEGVRYLTTEYVEGVALDAWMRAQRPSAIETIDVSLQIAAAIAAMHAAEVVHADLEPEQIFMAPSGRVVLMDLQMVRTIEEGPVDGRADLHALGLIMIEMLTGERPLASRGSQDHLDLDTLELPPPLLEPLKRCLAHDPAARFASASELADALVEARAQLQASANPHPTPRTTALIQQTTKALAVLPFRYRGPASESFVADALLDELTDVLSMTHGLKVSGSGATARFAEAGDRDPRVLGTELGVDVVVDGSIQLLGNRLRIAARLLDVHTGFQLWSERFDGELGDVFDLQDKLGQRIAEALRVELEVLGHDGLSDPEALESYLRARQAKLRWRLRGPDGALLHYQRVLARAPGFRPAIAGYALALVRAWFMPAEPDEQEIDWPVATAAAVARASSEAPDFPESQIAAASWSVQRGDYRAGAEHLREALRIAPTCALAHEYLGRLQTEAAQPEKGLRHLMLALELDPQLEWCHVDIARYRALEGDMASYREHMDQLFARTERLQVAAHLYEMRVGAWTRDLDMIRRALAQIDANSSNDAVRIMRNYGPPLLEPYDPEALASFQERSTRGVQNGRLRTLLFQMWAEQTAYWEDCERTLAHLEAATDLALVDLAWLDKCPLFEFVREQPRFAEVRLRVRARCEAIWASS